MSIFKQTIYLMQFIKYIVVGILCISCLSKKEPLNTTSIDLYPIFKECDSVATYKNSKDCFEKVTATEIKTYINGNETYKYLEKNTNYLIYLKVLKNGDFILDSIQSEEENYLHSLTTDIHKVFKNLHCEQAALKQGIPVDCTFIIPLHLKK